LDKTWEETMSKLLPLAWFGFAFSIAPAFAADSGEGARVFRDDGARDSGMMAPGSAAMLAGAVVALGLCRRQSSL
jgi:hypothetical protein